MSFNSKIVTVIITCVLSPHISRGNLTMIRRDMARHSMYDLGGNETAIHYSSNNLLSGMPNKIPNKAFPQGKSKLIHFAHTEPTRSLHSKNVAIPEQNQVLEILPTKIRQRRQTKTKSFMDGDTLVECFGKVYVFQAPIAIDACNRTKLSNPVNDLSTRILDGSTNASATPPPERKFSAMLVTVIFTVSTTGRKHVQDVVFADKKMLMDDLNKAKKKLKSEELAALQDLTQPAITYIKYKSELYIKSFGYESFIFEEWIKVHLATIKGTKDATDLSKDYADMKWEQPLRDTEAGTLQLIKITWGGENPQFSLISILFPKAGGEPHVMIFDGFGEGKPTTAPASALVKIIRNTGMVSMKEFSTANKPSIKLDLTTYTFVYNPAMVGPSLDVTFFCAFTADHSSCDDLPADDTKDSSNSSSSYNPVIVSSSAAEKRPRPDAAYLVTIIYTEDPDGRKRVVDIVLKNKQEMLTELISSKNQPKTDELALLQDLNGPSTAYVKLSTEPYKLIFGGDKFEYPRWLEAFKLSLVGPVVSSGLSTDFSGVDMREVIRDNGKSGTLHLIQLFWGWDSPLYTLVSIAYPKPIGEPQVALMDVFGDGKQKPVIDTMRLKIMMTPNNVSVRDITPAPCTPASKLNIAQFTFDPKPNLAGSPRETTFVCSFTSTHKSCGTPAPPPAPTAPPTTTATTVQPEAVSQPPPLLITIVYDLDPSTNNRFVSDVVFKNKKDLLDELGGAKATLNPANAQILNDLSGTSVTYMRLNSPPYTKLFAGDKFNFEAWAGHFQLTKKLPLPSDLFPKDMTEIVMKEVVKANGNVTIQRILLHWQGEPLKPDADKRFPVYTIVDIYFSCAIGKEPRVNVTDVYDPSIKSLASQYIVRTKIIRKYSLVVTVIETTVVSTVTTKFSILTYIYDLPRDTLHPAAHPTSFQHGFTAPIFTVKHVSTQSSIQTFTQTSQSSSSVKYSGILASNLPQVSKPVAHTGNRFGFPANYAGWSSASHSSSSSTSVIVKQQSSSTTILGAVPGLLHQILSPVTKLVRSLGFRGTVLDSGAIPYATPPNGSIFAAAVIPTVLDTDASAATAVKAVGRATQVAGRVAKVSGRKSKSAMLARAATAVKAKEKSGKRVASAGRAVGDPKKKAGKSVKATVTADNQLR